MWPRVRLVQLPPFSPPPRARPKRYTARARGETASLRGGGALPGPLSWSLGRPAPESSGFSCGHQASGRYRVDLQLHRIGAKFQPTRRRSPHASAGMSRPGANAAALSAGRFPLQTLHMPRVGSVFRWCAAPERHGSRLTGDSSHWGTLGGPSNRGTGPGKVVC
ncbi:hypothetical protein NDU88_005591 [Pleurodeles waltl]|uniref:Uncharacterized protein n=1 Tax=Pleurodeles waltl TaxID=8319 RepID=A0AAV7PKU8_PLEWA|nr:hypothetical protein NDU88_005591 [Pleurodeles waltl]